MSNESSEGEAVFKFLIIAAVMVISLFLGADIGRYPFITNLGQVVENRGKYYLVLEKN